MLTTRWATLLISPLALPSPPSLEVASGFPRSVVTARSNPVLSQAYPRDTSSSLRLETSLLDEPVEYALLLQ